MCKNLSRVLHILNTPPNTPSKMWCINFQCLGCDIFTQLNTVLSILPVSGLDVIEIPGSYSRLQQLDCLKPKLYYIYQCSSVNHSFLLFWFVVSRAKTTSQLSPHCYLWFLKFSRFPGSWRNCWHYLLLSSTFHQRLPHWSLVADWAVWPLPSHGCGGLAWWCEAQLNSVHTNWTASKLL